jgi:hypothetical protein
MFVVASCSRGAARHLGHLACPTTRLAFGYNVPFRLATRPTLASVHHPLGQQRAFSNLTPNPPPTAPKKNSIPQSANDDTRFSVSEQRKDDWNVVKKLIVHVWPKNDWKTRGTVLFGFGLLVGGKVRQLL